MTSAKSLASVLVAVGLAVGPAAAAFADTTSCDSYSGKCTTVEGTKITRTPTTPTTSTPSVLPFTGGEIVLMTAAGAAALGGGIVLVSAGRRRRGAAQPA